MKDYTIAEIDKVLTKAYLTVEDICRLAPIGRKEAYKLANKIIAEMQAEGLPRLCTRPILVPQGRVLAKLGISYQAHKEVR